jgi:hypothetical protein
MNARVFAALIRRNEQDYRKKTEKVRKIFRILKKEYTQVIAISMEDINKALFKLDRRNPVSNNEKVRKKFPKELKGLERCFDDDEGTAIPSHRPGRDHAIPLEKDEQGRERDVLWEPLYEMFREELLVLRKMLTDLLDKGWIRASSLAAEAPVLFVKKFGKGFRFCVNYRALNAIISQDRYPLPLIKKTLKGLAKARYYTKMNVRAAFYRFRIKKENKWKTAFRTRFGLFKWVITPFGLAEALAIFQRYINSILNDFFDKFCLAYMNDVFIYSNGSYQDYMLKMKKVLRRLHEAGLKFDIEKSEFAFSEVKYLGFIISAGEGIKVNPGKVEAIKKWEAPTIVKGVRSFIGFSNFYRGFIKNFSEVAAPLMLLIRKNQAWQWKKKQQKSFNRLKEFFILAPILAY